MIAATINWGKLPNCHAVYIVHLEYPNDTEWYPISPRRIVDFLSPSCDRSTFDDSHPHISPTDCWLISSTIPRLTSRHITTWLGAWKTAPPSKNQLFLDLCGHWGDDDPFPLREKTSPQKPWFSPGSQNDTHFEARMLGMKQKRRRGWEWMGSISTYTRL